MKELYDIKVIQDKIGDMKKTEDFHFTYKSSTPFTFMTFGLSQFLCMGLAFFLLFYKTYSFDNFFDIIIFFICSMSVIFSSFTVTSYLGQYNDFFNKYMSAFFLTGCFIVPILFIVLQPPISVLYYSIVCISLIGFILSLKHISLCKHWNKKFIDFNIEKDKLKKEKQDIVTSILNDDNKILMLTKIEDNNIKFIKNEILTIYEKKFKDELNLEKIIEAKHNSIVNY